MSLTDAGQYDAVIAAATFIPKQSVFPLGGVRIGAGTGNMGSHSWGGADGKGGGAPLMNTPGCNSRATAHMVLKAILKVSPDLCRWTSFTDAADGTPSGPLAAYLPLMERHGDRLELLPHAAADTDHPSRVAGAKQAVDQIFDVITHRRVRNLVGDLPEGYERGPDTVPLGIGRVTPEIVETVAADREALTALLDSAEATATFWRKLAQIDDPETRITAIRQDGAEALKAAARQRSLLRQLGLDVPFAP